VLAAVPCVLLLSHQNAEAYLLPKTSPDQPEQWPVLVLEPMFWLLYAVQSMIGMGECVCVCGTAVGCCVVSKSCA
jgi:hypothetical protein